MERLYDIRPQQRTGSDNALEGVFRVYLTSEALVTQQVKQGDWVMIRNRVTGKGGLGIAWRVQESNVKRDCVKIHDALRTLYQIELKDKVSLAKYSGEGLRAEKIILRDVTDGANATGIGPSEVAELRLSAMAALYAAEAVIEGFEITVSCKTGFKTNRKRRLQIGAVTSRVADQEGTRTPYYVAHDTQIEFSDVSTAKAKADTPTPTPSAFRINSADLYGLDRQIRQLNTTMHDMRQQLGRQRKFPAVNRPGPILIYGPEGSGKTTLLQKIAKANWAKVTSISCGDISASAEKARTALNNAFKDVNSVQLTCIVLDKLDLIVGSQSETNVSVVDGLADKLRHLQGAHVLVVATVKKPTDLHGAVLRCFRQLIELPIPTEVARFQILQSLMDGADLGQLQRVAERTPAFVSDDLQTLCVAAIEHAKSRQNGQDVYLNLVTDNNQALSNGDDNGPSINGGHDTKHGIDHDDDKVDEEDTLQITAADFEYALDKVHASVLHEAYIEVPKVHWTNIGGSHNIKAKLAKILTLPTQHPQLMSRFKVEPSSGILLYGPPGCSKTLTAKAVATESGRNFIAVKGPELISKYVGESELKIREVFRKARDAAPCVIFFDEVDSIAPRRDGGSGGHEGLNTVAALLNEMDGIEGSKGVLVLAATNRPEQIDPALLRPQRLGTLLYLGPPNAEARRQILDMKTRDRYPGEDLDIDVLTERTEGYSGADVVELCNLAAYEAVEEAVNRTKGLDKDADATQRPEDDVDKTQGVKEDTDTTHGHDEAMLTMAHFDKAFAEMKPTLSRPIVTQLENWSVVGLAQI